MIDVREFDDVFRVVVVSAADVSRGPAVQRVLRAHLAALGSSQRVVLSSSGTTAVAGRPMHPHMARALTEVTPDTGPHLSRPVSERRLAQADLILTVSRTERRLVGELRPLVAGRTFTVVEFARLVTGVGEPVGDPRRLVGLLAGLRSEIRPVDPGEDDLEDPTPGQYRDHERLVRRVDHAARDIARGLSGQLGAVDSADSGGHPDAEPAAADTTMPVRTTPTPSPVLPASPERREGRKESRKDGGSRERRGARADSPLTVPEDAVPTGTRSGDRDTDDPTFGPYPST